MLAIPQLPETQQQVQDELEENFLKAEHFATSQMAEAAVQSCAQIDRCKKMLKDDQT